MDGGFGLGMLFVALAATKSVMEENEVSHIRVFAEISGMRNPGKLTDERGSALLLGSLRAGRYPAKFETVRYRGVDGYETFVEMLIVFDPIRKRWVGKSVRQWDEDQLKWMWESREKTNDSKTER